MQLANYYSYALAPLSGEGSTIYLSRTKDAKKYVASNIIPVPLYIFVDYVRERECPAADVFSPAPRWRPWSGGRSSPVAEQLSLF